MRVLLAALTGALAILGRDTLRADSRVPLVATNNSYSMEMPALAPTNPASVSGNVLTDDGAVPAPGTPLTPRLISGPAGGTLAPGGLNKGGVKGSFTYTPAAHFHGVDSFTYVVNDAPASATLQIATSGTLLAAEGTTRLQSWLGPVRLTRVYNAAIDGFAVSSFHTAVDGIGPTLTVMRVRDQFAPTGAATQIIGGFNPQPWSSSPGRDCTNDDCYQMSTSDAARTAFLFNLTTGMKLDQRLTTNRCSSDALTDPDCGSYQTGNNPNWGPAFGGPAGSGQDLSVGCSIEAPECNGDLRFGTAYAQSYGGQPRTGAFWLPGAQHPSIFASSWLENDPAKWPDFVNCRASCGAFVVEAFEVFTLAPVSGAHDSGVATVTIHITGNTRPDAVDDAAAVPLGQSVNIAILANDSDAETDPLTMVVGKPAHGTVVVNEDWTVTYTPSGTIGPDPFIYTVDDGFGGQDTATVTVDVTPMRILTVKVDGRSKTYDAARSGFTVSQLSDQPCTVLTPPVYGGPAVSAINRGSYAVTVAGVTSSDCSVRFVPGVLEIVPAPLTITPRDSVKTYGQAFSPLGDIDGLQGDDALSITATYASTGAAGTALVGTYPVTVATITDGGTGKLANYTYDRALRAGKLTVNKKTLTVIPTPLAKAYGTAATLTGVISGQLPGDAFAATYSSDGTPASAGSGGYAIMVSSVTGAALNNYTQDLKTATLTVNKAVLTVTPAALTKTYGSIAALTGVITGQRGTDVFTATYASTGAAAGVKTGTDAITVASVTGAKLANYTQDLKSATLTVSGRPVTVAANLQTKPLGAVDPPLTYQITSGSLATGDAFSGELSRVSGQSVGSYLIQQGSLALGSNYLLTFVPAKLTILGSDDSWTRDRDGHWWRKDRDDCWWKADDDGHWWRADNDGHWLKRDRDDDWRRNVDEDRRNDRDYDRYDNDDRR